MKANKSDFIIVILHEILVNSTYCLYFTITQCMHECYTGGARMLVVSLESVGS